MKYRGSLAICTALCLRVEGGRVTIAAGGHPLPLLVRDDVVEPVGRHGSLLGALRNAGWPETVCTLGAGDLLVMFTDGVTDALGTEGNRFGASRLNDHLVRADSQSATSVCRSITESIRTFQYGEQADDIAIVALRYLGEPAPDQLFSQASPTLSTTGAK